MGRRQLGRVKKKPSDYPQFTFRVSREDKKALEELIDNAHDLYNRGRSSELPRLNKNDIIVAAIKRGLGNITSRRRGR